MIIPDKYENSIIGDFKRIIWSKFLRAVKDYDLIQAGDRIAVCISGGKDSMLLAKCMQRLQRYSKVPFGVEYLVMDPGYAPANRRKIENNAAALCIPVKIFETNIFNAVVKIENNPCYLCARMRRGWLYRYAQDLGCNKIALGHHFNDVVETILMGMLYGSQMQTMMPKLHSENFAGMQLIRPLYLVREEHIIEWAAVNGLSFIQCACRFTELAAQEEYQGMSKRQEVKALIKKLRETDPDVEKHIFRSVENVNLQTLISYHIGDEYHHFLDSYGEGRSIRGTVHEDV